jgi:hypothetical protein
MLSLRTKHNTAGHSSPLIMTIKPKTKEKSYLLINLITVLQEFAGR